MAHVQTSVLDIAYEPSGPLDSFPVVLLHGYPYDVKVHSMKSFPSSTQLDSAQSRQGDERLALSTKSLPRNPLSRREVHLF